MTYLLLYPIAPALLVGYIVWFFRKKQGFTSKTQIISTAMVVYAGIYFLLKFLTTSD